MNPVTIQLVKRISQADEPLSTDDHSLLLAHEIIAKVRIANFVPCEQSICDGDFGELDVSALRAVLLAYTKAHPDHESRASAFWGLAALHDSNERDFLRGLLQIESAKESVDENVLWQIMIALDDIGEDIMRPIDEDPVEQSGDRWAASRLYLASTA